MKKELTAFLVLEGYAPVSSNLPEFLVFLKKEYRHFNVLFVMELENDSTCTEERYRSVQESAYRLLEEKGLEEMHILTIVISGNPEHALKMTKDDKYAWVIHRDEKNLIADENRVEDFYGMKRKLNQFLSEPEAAQRSIEAAGLAAVEKLEAEKKIQPKMVVPWVTLGIILLNVIIYIICTYTGNLLYNVGRLNLESVLEHAQWYRVITSIFLHGSTRHIMNNMLILYLLGSVLEISMGKWKFLIYYIVCGMFASVVSLFGKWLEASSSGSVGASGAIFGLLGIFLVLEISGTQFKKITFRNIYRIILPIVCVLLGIYGDVKDASIDHYAHIGGLIAGVVLQMIRLYMPGRTVKEEKHES